MKKRDNLVHKQINKWPGQSVHGWNNDQKFQTLPSIFQEDLLKCIWMIRLNLIEVLFRGRSERSFKNNLLKVLRKIDQFQNRVIKNGSDRWVRGERIIKKKEFMVNYYFNFGNIYKTGSWCSKIVFDFLHGRIAI